VYVDTLLLDGFCLKMEAQLSFQMSASCLPMDTTSHPRRHESSGALLW